jgi:hypothetical protein
MINAQPHDVRAGIQAQCALQPSSVVGVVIRVILNNPNSKINPNKSIRKLLGLLTSLRNIRVVRVIRVVPLIRVLIILVLVKGLLTPTMRYNEEAWR